MGLAKVLTLSAAVLIGCLLLVTYVESCNEIVCASVVSKCMLTQSCKCDAKNCTCCKKCADCLSNLYHECCSCVDLCPRPNSTQNPLSKISHVEDFQGFPELFYALTNESDKRWHTVKFPIDFDLILSGPKLNSDVQYYLKSNEHDLEQSLKEKDNTITVNCTVAYLNQCLSYNKCKESCATMGANSFRWFHDGCCECVGPKCINYGINESRCVECPDHQDDLYEPEEISDDLQDYGDDMGPFDGSVNTNS